MIYNNSFNIFILLISIKMLKQKQTSQQVQNLIHFAYSHINNLPKQKIEQAVILVSVNNGMQHVYKTLINADIFADEAKQPQFQYIGDKKIPLIYPTEAFLDPQKEHNFVSMHYLLNTVRRAKFVFAFKHSDLIQQPMRNIKKTIQNLISLFEKSIPNVGSKLSQSCGYIINEAKMNDKAKYIQILSALHKQANYVSNNQVKNLSRQSINSNQIILFYAEKNKNQESAQLMFSDLTKNLKYFELPSQIEPAIFSAEKDYIPNKIYEIWSDYFKKLYNNLQLIITQSKNDYQPAVYIHRKNDKVKEKDIRMQEVLAATTELYIHRSNWEKQWPEKPNLTHKALRICRFIQKYLTMIGQIRQLSTQNYKETEEIVTFFMKTLFNLGFLQKYHIYFFITSFFQIQSFLSNCKNQINELLFEKVNFKQIIMDPKIIDQKMSFLINYLYNILDQEILNSDIGYPFIQIIQSITQTLKKLAVSKYGFATERTFKKLMKYKAQLAFKRANLVTNAYNIPKSEIRNSWVEFLGYAQESSLIQSSKLEQALSFIAQELTKNKSIQLALKVYSYLPEYKSYKKIIAIYERDSKFNPEIMKYTLSYDWPSKREKFEDYCKFLLKIGYNQQVRGLCLQGLKIIEDDEEGIQLLKGLLISARGEQGRDIHNSFLQNLSEEQMKKIKIDEKLLTQIRDEFKKI